MTLPRCSLGGRARLTDDPTTRIDEDNPLQVGAYDLADDLVSEWRSAAPREPVPRLLSAIDFLRLAASDLWKAQGRRTFCNLASVALARLHGLYLPRCWWYRPERADGDKDPAYADRDDPNGCHEINANGLLQWADQWAMVMGWHFAGRDFQSDHTTVFPTDRDELIQVGIELAQTGQVVFLIAEHKNPRESGHIAQIRPDAPDYVEAGYVRVAQAGRTSGPDVKWPRDSINSFGRVMVIAGDSR